MLVLVPVPVPVPVPILNGDWVANDFILLIHSFASDFESISREFLLQNSGFHSKWKFKDSIQSKKVELKMTAFWKLKA